MLLVGYAVNSVVVNVSFAPGYLLLLLWLLLLLQETFMLLLLLLLATCAAVVSSSVLVCLRSIIHVVVDQI